MLQWHYQQNERTKTVWEDDDSLWADYYEIDDKEQYEIDCLYDDDRIDRLVESDEEADDEDEDDDL